MVGLRWNPHFLISYHRLFENVCIAVMCQAPLVKETDIIPNFTDLPGQVEETEILNVS